jgi:phosphomethylpyrimidine synthase
MRITQEVRSYAAQKGVTDAAKALEQGMKEKAAEFMQQGGDVYRKL